MSIRVGSTLIVTQTEAVYHRIERVTRALNQAIKIDVEVAVPVKEKAADPMPDPTKKD